MLKKLFVENSIRCLENYLDLVNLTYYGGQAGQLT